MKIFAAAGVYAAPPDGEPNDWTEHLSAVEGVVSTRVRIATRLYHEGSAWRLEVLPPSTVTELARLRGETAADGESPNPIESTPSGIARRSPREVATNEDGNFAEMSGNS